MSPHLSTDRGLQSSGSRWWCVGGPQSLLLRWILLLLLLLILLPLCPWLVRATTVTRGRKKSLVRALETGQQTRRCSLASLKESIGGTLVTWGVDLLYNLDLTKLSRSRIEKIKLNSQSYFHATRCHRSVGVFERA